MSSSVGSSSSSSESVVSTSDLNGSSTGYVFDSDTFVSNLVNSVFGTTGSTSSSIGSIGVSILFPVTFSVIPGP